MSLSRWLDRLFRPASSGRRRDRRFVPSLETLEDRVTPSIWVVGSLADDGTKDTLRYILQNNAKANDVVVFSQSLWANAYTAANVTDPNGPDTIVLQKIVPGLTGGPLVIPQGVNVIGPSPNVALGYYRPLIAISGSNLKSSTNTPYSENVINMTGSTSNSIPFSLNLGYSPVGDGQPPLSLGNLYPQTKSPGPNMGNGSGVTVVAFLTIENAQAYQAGVEMIGGVSNFLDGCTVQNCLGQGVYNNGTANAYIPYSDIAHNGTGSGGGTGWGGLYNQSGNMVVQYSLVESNVSTVQPSGQQFGGGITNVGPGQLYVEDSTLWANSSQFGGGGILNTAGDLYLHSATIANNGTTAKGGGVMLQGAMNILSITNTIIAQNHATSGAPTYNDIYQFKKNGDPNNNVVTHPFFRFDLIGDAAGAPDFLSATTGWTGTNGAATPPSVGGQIGIETYDPIKKTINQNPPPSTLIGTNANQIFVNDYKTTGGVTTHPLSLAANGGPTRTVALLVGSPAIDAGDDLPADASANFFSWDDNSNLNGFVGLGSDQRTDTRFYPPPVGPQDIGAFEYEPVAPVTISPATLPNAIPNTPYNATLTASGGNGNGFTFTDAGAPGWLNLSNAGVFSGNVPVGFTNATFTVTATDSSGNSTTVTYTLATGVTITPTTMPSGLVNQVYTVTLTAGNGTAPYTFINTGLPGWLTVTGTTGTTETLGGTPTKAGVYGSINVKATDSAAKTTAQVYSVTIYPALTLTPGANPATTALPAATTNTLYTQSFAAVGGSGSGYTFAEAGMPAWLTVTGSATTGNLTLGGTPMATAGAVTFSITVTDGAGDKTTDQYTILVEKQITITAPASLPLGTAANAYNQSTGPFTATGGIGAPYTFSATGLPGGMSVAGNVLTGTPTAGGVYTVIVTATDSAGAKGTKTYTLNIDSEPTVTPATLPVATLTNVYGPVILVPSGGAGGPPASYTVGVVGLPAGLNFNPATDIISGTPTASGPFTVTVTIKDSIGATGTVTYNLTVDTAPGATPANLPYAAQGGPYSATITGTGGSGSGYTFKVIGVGMPAGLSLNANGTFSGTTNAATGAYSFQVQITDGIKAVGTQNYTINVENAITFAPNPLPNGTVNTVYNQGPAIVASGGSGTFGALTEVGTIPGLTFSGGTFTGTPTKVGSYPFTITVTDSLGGTGKASFTFVVDPPVTLNPAALPVATDGDPYDVTLVGGGGSGTGYVYTISGQPAWLSIVGNQLKGTPPVVASATTSSSFTITVTDSANGTATNTYTVTVDPPLTLSPGSLFSTPQNDPYYAPMTGGGGSGAGFVFSTTGNLPAGLGFSGSVLTGVATSAPGTYNFNVVVTDSNGGTVTQSYSINVTAPISITPTTLPNGTTGQVYPVTQLIGNGGSGGYVFSQSGTLPPGISFNQSTATFSGTPTGYGTYNFQISATDSRGGTHVQPYSIVINFSLGTSPNALFVDAVYQKLLGHAPGPSSQVWVNMLNGGAAPSTIVADIEGSTEYLADVVTGIYERYLHRGTAGDIGAAGWLNALEQGQTIDTVTANILASQGYFNANGGTNDGFVSGLYHDLLGRAPDAAGFNAWTSYLNAGGSRYVAAYSFLTSTEYRRDLVNSDYQTYLYRSGGASELAGWTASMQAGMTDQAVLAAIFGSPEGYRKNS